MNHHLEPKAPWEDGPSASPDAALLDAWERSLGRPPAERPLVLLDAAAGGGARAPAVADLPLGQRDRRLLELRLRLFGPRFELRSDCPSCGEALELSLDGDELLAHQQPAAVGTETEVECGGLAARLRPVTGGDLVLAAAAADAAAAERLLLAACVVEARRDGQAVTLDELDDGERQALAAALADLDPGAEVRLDVACPACGTDRREIFDVAAVVTAEVDGLARRLLREVATLARGYGWREADVLALSPRRRRAYLELLGA